MEKKSMQTHTRTHSFARTQSENISPTTNKIEISNHKNGIFMYVYLFKMVVSGAC